MREIFFPLLDLDFGWLVVGCAFPWWWRWLGADLCFPFLKIGFLHLRPNARNNFPS